MPLERERRATAGKRLSALVGRALEDDAAFWGHETWASDGGSDGAESFHSSDEDSQFNQDEFDSDFDETEESEDEEAAAAAAAEEEEEDAKRKKKKKPQSSSSYVDIAAKASRANYYLAHGGKKGKSRRIIGDGVNTGIVLNLPFLAAQTAFKGISKNASLSTASKTHIPPAPLPPPRRKPPPPQPVESLDANQQQQSTAATIGAGVSATSLTAAAASTAYLPLSSRPSNSATKQQHHQPPSTTGVATRPRRRQQQTSKYSSRYRAAAATTTASSATTSGTSGSPTTAATTSASAPKKGQQQQRKRKFTQGELLLEAVHETEPENHRWLLARKRTLHDNSDASSKEQGRSGGSGAGTVVERFSSRRGCLNVVTFMDMDRIPPVLLQQQRQRSPPSSPKMTNQPQHRNQPQSSNVCVITGKPARYRCPQTLLPFHDKEAYQVMQRKIKEGELDALMSGGSNNCTIKAAVAASTLAKATGSGNATAGKPDDEDTKLPVAPDGKVKGSDQALQQQDQQATVPKMAPLNNDVQKKPKSPISTGSNIAAQIAASIDKPGPASEESSAGTVTKVSGQSQQQEAQQSATTANGNDKIASSNREALTASAQTQQHMPPTPGAVGNELPSQRPRSGSPVGGTTSPSASTKNDGAAPPSSPSRRQSPRRRRPSIKALQNMQVAGTRSKTNNSGKNDNGNEATDGGTSQMPMLPNIV